MSKTDGTHVRILQLLKEREELRFRDQSGILVEIESNECMETYPKPEVTGLRHH